MNTGQRNGVTKLTAPTKTPRNPNIMRKATGSKTVNQNAGHNGARTSGMVKVHNAITKRCA